jgi:hypothetical protein
VTFNVTLTFAGWVAECLPDPAVDLVLLEQRVKTAAAYTPPSLNVTGALLTAQCLQAAATGGTTPPLRQFLNLTVTMRGLTYGLAINSAV